MTVIYFHFPELKPAIFQLVTKNASLRIPPIDSLREFNGKCDKESIFHMRTPTLKLRRPWAFCKCLKNSKIGEDARRDPQWSKFAEEVVNDIDKHPGRSVFESMENILGGPMRDEIVN